MAFGDAYTTLIMRLTELLLPPRSSDVYQPHCILNARSFYCFFFQQNKNRVTRLNRNDARFLSAQFLSLLKNVPPVLFYYFKNNSPSFEYQQFFYLAIHILIYRE